MLPENNTQWPPAEYAAPLEHMAEWSAWYSGDPAQLSDYYSAASRPVARTRDAQLHGGVVGKVARWWWGVPAAAGETPAKLHVPLAADICGTSADLLFSEPVQLATKQKGLQEAFDTWQDGGLDSKLHEAGEVTAALGGGYLRTCWDRQVSDQAWTDAVHADMALPEFRWGRLEAVTFWQLLPSTGGRSVWRLMERHERGAIIHALYEGTEDNVGRQVPLQDHPTAEPLAAVVNEDGVVPTGSDRLTAIYVPNMLPNRRARGSHQGRSDLQGVEPLLDALDEAYSSWWRDIRHAKSRIHVPRNYLESAGPGEPGIAQTEAELYVPMDGVLAGPGDGMLLEAQQFKIRVAEHMQTCEAWTDRIIESAGYSTQSLSSGQGEAVTAAEVHSHERRSYMTRGKKERYWKAAIREHLMSLVEVGNANLSGRVRPDDFTVAFQDGVQESALSLAQTSQALRNAEAASVQTRVQMVHPDWTADEVQAEAELVLAQSGGAPVADPLGGQDAGF